MKRTPIVITIAAATLVVAAIIALKFDAFGSEARRVSFGPYGVIAEVADSQEERERGLRGHEELTASVDATEGMLFIFDANGLYEFTMEGMSFPIDIIWLDEHARVVDIWNEASTTSVPIMRASKAPARYVLEVPAGWSRETGVGIGSVAELN